MLGDILLAQKSIYWEVYIFLDDEIGKTFADALEAKAAAGVDVKLVIDALGSFGLPKKRIESMRKAGIDIQIFNERKRFRGWWKLLLTRTHRKILIIDEKVGFIGGVNIEAVAKDWLDIHVRVEGKIVHSLLRSFAKMYVIAGGSRNVVRTLLRYRRRVNIDEELQTQFFEHRGNAEYSRLRERYSHALLHARERVILFSPYYFPDKKFLYALWKAKKRGVRVDLLLPMRTDIRLATYAAYALFAVLTKMGIHISMHPKMMHGKGVVVDDDFAIIGSGNLDQTSFYDNYEAGIMVRDKQFVHHLRETMDHWLSEATEVKSDAWEKRGIRQRFKEWVALKLYRLWHRH